MIQQPKPESKKYSDLISEIQKWEIKIPKFQRAFVREISKTAELLDSIVKWYPIWTFIMRETVERFNDIKNIWWFTFPDPKDWVKIQYVLDWQQRMTSLVAAYLWAKMTRYWDRTETDYSNIYVDLSIDIDDTESQIITSELPQHDNYISLHKILKFNEFYWEISQLWPEIAQKINMYYNIFNWYDFSTIILRKDDIYSAIEVFTRINTWWKELTLFEIMSAKTYDMDLDFDMQDKREEYINTLKNIWYDTISSTIILHILSLIISKTKECKRKVILKLEKKSIIEIWDQAIDSLSTAVTYFRTVYRIPISWLLPFDSLLVTFSYFFFRKWSSDLTSQESIYLEEFFWRASLSFRYGTSPESRLAQDIKRMDEILNGIRPEYNEWFTLGINNVNDLVNREFSVWNSLCKAILCLFIYFEPKEFNADKKVILDNSWIKRADSKNFHHFFPRSYLSKNNIYNENSIMNITLVSDSLNKRTIWSKSPSRYIWDFIEDNEYITQQSLKTHLISDYKEFGILSDDYSVFLQKRAEKVYKELTKRIEWKSHLWWDQINIKHIIINWENEKTEFKETLRWDIKQWIINPKMEFSVAKTLCAFMNTDGGFLLIWVADDESIPWLNRDYNTFSDGKRNKDGFELHFKWVIKKYLWENLEKYIKISFPAIDDTEICLVEVSKNSTPIFVKFEGKEEYYIRNGNGSEPKSGSWLIWYL